MNKAESTEEEQFEELKREKMGKLKFEEGMVSVRENVFIDSISTDSL